MDARWGSYASPVVPPAQCAGSSSWRFHARPYGPGGTRAGRAALGQQGWGDAATHDVTHVVEVGPHGQMSSAGCCGTGPERSAPWGIARACCSRA